MPYINQTQRDRIRSELDALIEVLNDAGSQEIDGLLNYVFTMIVLRVMGKNGWRYQMLARAVGLFECAKLEFYRKIAAPYEEDAIEKNGPLKV